MIVPDRIEVFHAAGLGLLVGVSLVGADMVVAALRRRRQSTAMLIVASALPLVAVAFVVVWKWIVVDDPSALATDRLSYRVAAGRGGWHIRHPGGARVGIDRFDVPIGIPIVLEITADTDQRFVIPAMRLDRELVRERRLEVWFEATQLGTYPFAVSYPGSGLVERHGEVRVLSLAAFEQGHGRVTQGEEGGARLWRSCGCLACHSNDATPSKGPSFFGLWGSERTLADGTKVIADERYFLQSALRPNETIVAGYERSSCWSSINPLQATALMAWVKTLR